MSRFPSQLACFFMLLLFFKVGTGQSIRCVDVERQALLEFKQGLEELEPGFLLSWGSEEEKRECCEWRGVQCSNTTSHIISLNLAPPTYVPPSPPLYLSNYGRVLRGNISSSLAELKHLTHLDLSFINFASSVFPSYIGGLSKLRYLNFSCTMMRDELPHHLGNLSSLQVLDIGYSSILTIKNIEWLSRLSTLKHLDLTYINMSQVPDWLRFVNKLPRLTNLHLQGCSLSTVVFSSSVAYVNSSLSLTDVDLSRNILPASVFRWLFTFSRSLVRLEIVDSELSGSIPEDFGNMTVLEHLDLAVNEFKGCVPSSLGNLTFLSYLRLSWNKLECSIPESLGNLIALKELYLNENNFQGEFPKSIWNICMLRSLSASQNNLSSLEPFESLPRCTNHSLEFLDLSFNRIVSPLPNLALFPSLKQIILFRNAFSGTVPESIGNLAELVELNLAENSLEGVLSESHFSKMSKLSELWVSHNSLVFNFSHQWVPPFQLGIILLHSCYLGPQFPIWLRSQNNFSSLDISNSGISDSIPDWFWNSSAKSVEIDLSNNQIHGGLMNYSFGFVDHPTLDLSSNKLEGPVPLSLFKIGSLNLSTNRISRLDSICNVLEDFPLSYLDVSFNLLSGELPDCWSYFKSLRILVLEGNRLSGRIPSSIGSLTDIEILHFGNNHFSMELPSSLKNCSKLFAIDVGENNLTGPIPNWIGESLSNLVILILRSNRFFGTIPARLCHLTHLQLLDLSSNNISGRVPNCIGNFTAMKQPVEDERTWVSTTYSYDQSTSRTYYAEARLVWKGRLSEFGITLGLVKGIDMSSNRLSGDIPTEITELVECVFLNLSRNELIGQIPSEIGNLSQLGALDLSNNNLSGLIPSSLSQVHRLNTLDLSNNDLSGEIPTGTQLQSFDASSYTGNLDLCGAPLPKSCTGDESSTSSKPHPEAQDEEDQDKLVTEGFYISLGVGFVVGFWGVCIYLILNMTRREISMRQAN